MTRSVLWYIGAFLLGWVPSTAAATDDDPWVAFHGFVSPGFIYTTENNYLADSDHGSFEFVEIGLNATVTPVEDLRIGLQLFARDLGPTGDYTPEIDWAYLDYNVTDWLGLRAGRVKLPFGLYNEVSDIDAARIPVLLPQSVYPTQNRDFLLAQTGAELYGYVDLGDGGALEYRIYGGTIFLEPDLEPGSPFEVSDLTIPWLAGGRVMWDTPLQGLRLGASVQALRLESSLLFTQPAPGELDVDIDAILWVVSAEFTFESAVLAAEYSRWHVDTTSSDPSAFPENDTVSERAYGSFSYRVSPWLAVGAYYSLHFNDVADRSGRENRQHDAAATLRFDITEFWLAKLEGHYMNGTLALDPELNDGTPRSELEKHWGIVLVKTTAYF